MSTTTKSSFFCVLLAIGISIYYNFFIIKENIIIPKRWQVNTFDLSIDTEGKQAIKITTINNFMPKQLAINMYKQLEKKYNNMDSNDLLLLSNKNFSSSNDKNKNEYESWVYASNTGGGNQKIRSNENIINRHKKAVELAGKKHLGLSRGVGWSHNSSPLFSSRNMASCFPMANQQRIWASQMEWEGLVP